MWKLTITIWTYLTVLCVHDEVSRAVTGVILEDRLSPNAIESLDQLCPRVDICNQNVSEPIVQPNGFLDDGYISLCHGCSCHKDCHTMLNCCFPGGTQIINNEKAETPRATSRRPIDGSNTPNVTDMPPTNTKHTPVNGNTPPRFDNDTISFGNLENTLPNDESMAGDGIDTPDDTTRSIKECLYTRSGSPDKRWVEQFLAFRMVSKAPVGGCEAIALNQAVREGTRDDDPCGPESVALWGDLYPVYSKKYRAIYKNERCARCHGVHNYEHWTPILACDTFDKDTGRDIPVSEHFDFLHRNVLPPRCFISFDYHDIAVLQDNRCYVNPFAECAFSTDAAQFSVPKGLNLTRSEITTACDSGLISPVQRSMVYQNIFCAICNDDVYSIQGLKRSPEFRGKKGFRATMNYLLDTSFIKANTLTGTSRPSVPYPEVCLRNGSMWVTESCRPLLCSTGRLRNNEGVCKFPSKRWNLGGFLFTAKLTYVNTHTSILESSKSGKVSTDTLLSGVHANKPWPSRWRISTIMHSSSDADTDGTVAIRLTATDMTRPAAVTNDIRKALAQPWIMQIDKMNVTFEQSILEYSMHYGGTIVPSWQVYADELERLNITKMSPITWSNLHVYRDSKISADFYPIPKSFTCEQVSLFDDEYSLIANDLILINKLTGRMLFDREFDLVENASGRIIPRVCLSDTPFVLRTGTASCAPNWSAVLPAIISGVSVLYFGGVFY